MAEQQHEDTKICPRCAETIKLRAVLCRFCGAEFAASEVDIDAKNNAPAPVDSRLSSINASRGVTLFVSLAVAALIIYGLNQSSERNQAAETNGGTLPDPAERLPALTGADLKTAALAEILDIRRSIEPPPLKQSTLRVGNWHWGENYSYAIAEGLVTNKSSESIENILAVVTFFDRYGNMITSDDALIEYRPLLPEQTSPFKVIVPYNPAMQSASLEFKNFRGQILDWQDSMINKGNVKKINEERLIEISQGYLIFLGYLKGDINRKLDSRTVEAVKQFQRDYKLDLNGKISVELAAAARVASQRAPVSNISNKVK
jgi:hypothetical protein